MEFDLKFLLVPANITAFSFFFFFLAKLYACVWEQVDGRGSGPVVYLEVSKYNTSGGYFMLSLIMGLGRPGHGDSAVVT